jgi:hypothetical protein
MARKKRVIRCSCRTCNRGLHRKRHKAAQSTRNEVFYAIRSERRAVASLLRSNDDSRRDLAQDIIVSAGYTD